MKTIDLTVNVPEGRVITVKLPEDISPGEHRVVMVIDEHAAGTNRRPLFSTEGIWAGGPDISPEDIAEARREMWRKFYE